MSSVSSSQSTTTPVETKENSLIDALSGVASGIAGQMQQWAQQEFAKTSAVTDQTIGNFMQASQQMMGLSNNLTSQYNNLFAPENADLVRDADSYASTDRQQVDMGQAGATQQQAGDQALKNSEANLVSMGIDPSSGRYAALDKAAAVQNAANVAGAENMQRNQDIQTGQALRSEAVQVGSQLPAAISNATNTGIQANSAAENASLSNANTGVNMNNLANSYLQTAMGIKLPASQTQSSSSGSSISPAPASHSGSSSPSGSGGGGSGAGGAPNGGGSSWSGMAPNTAAMGNGGGGAGQGKGGQPSAGIQSVPGGGAGGGGADWGGVGNEFGGGVQGPNSPAGGTDWDQWTNGPALSDNLYGSGSMGIQNGAESGIGNLDDNPFNDGGFGQTLPNDGGWSGGADQTFGDMGGGTDTEWGNISYNPAANQGGFGDNSGNTADQTFDTGDFMNQEQAAPDTNWSGGNAAYNDYGQSGGDDSGYAGGGAVQARPTTGGPVRPQASPSGGARTDDVKANLNAGEFVVPQDVTRWKGEEFMHNLIAQSRKKRMDMQAALGTGAKPSPAQPGPARFQSQPMGGR